MTTDAPRASSRRLVVVGPSARALVRLCGRFIASCIARGVHVQALAPEGSASDAESLVGFGAQVGVLPQGPKGFTLFRARKASRAFADQLHAFHPDAVLVFGTQIAPVAVAASRRAGVKRIALLVNELPFDGAAKKLKLAVKAASVVIAYNDADARTLATSLGAAEIVSVPGSGVDLSQPLGIPMPVDGEPIVFMAADRLDRAKGIHDYLEAARIAVERGVPARFLLAGPEGVEAGSIKPETLKRYAAVMTYLGDRENLVDDIRGCHAFVCPSHHEGMPGAVLQALAAGRAIIATEVPGARDTVDEMVNGTLVKPGDPGALADAFARIVRHRGLLNPMSRASRAKAERGFGETKVHDALRAALHI